MTGSSPSVARPRLHRDRSEDEQRPVRRHRIQAVPHGTYRLSEAAGVTASQGDQLLGGLPEALVPRRQLGAPPVVFRRRAYLERQAATKGRAGEIKQTRKGRST